MFKIGDFSRLCRVPVSALRYLVCRGEDGAFRQQGIYAPDETFESAVLGSRTVSLDSIFAG